MKQSFLIGIIALAAFAAGIFIASPELRAYAANTIGSADIINESILSADIKNGEVKTTELAANAVTSSKIAAGAVTNSDISNNSVTGSKILNGTISYGDLNRGFVAVEHRDDCNCGGTGWDPDGTSNKEIIYDTRITPSSVVVVTGIFAPTNYTCQVDDPAPGNITVSCAAELPEGYAINYAIFNPR
jgi:hypothetical protein